MSKQIGVEPTAKVIDNMADELMVRAIELRRLAKQMRESNELSYAAEAISIAANTMTGLRMDLLVTRPLRELGVK